MSSVGHALLAASLVLFAAGARASEDAHAVLARVRAALGGDALEALGSSRAKLHVETQGLSGEGERVEDLTTGRYVERVDLGVIALTQGFDGETPWSIEGNNPARPERDENTLTGAVSDAYRRSFSHLTQRRPGRIESLGERREGERSFALLRISPTGGRPFELWLDAQTWLPERVVEQDASDTLTTHYSDWRQVDGVAVPFGLRQSNGDAKYDTITTLESIAFGGPVADAEFAMPAPPPRDFGIAGDAAATTIPFELANNHIYLEVKLDGRVVSLVCDTGGLNIVTPELARELGLAVSGQIEGRGVGEQKVDVGVTRIGRMEIGDAHLENQTFYVVPLAGMSAVEGRPAHGIVGYEVFRRFVARIDYDELRLTLHDPARFRYRGDGAALDFVFNEHIPRIEAEVDGIRGAFDLDTGARSSLVLARPFVEKHGLREKLSVRPGGPIVTGWGVGGPSRAELARVRGLKIAGFEVRAPVTHLSAQERGAFAASDLAGNIGGGILRRFDLTFDYEHQRLWLEPNARFAEPDAYDRAGLWLNDAGSALEVMDVTPGGPAERAGLRAGDRILAVDGKPVAPGDLLRLRARLVSDAPGTALSLEVDDPTRAPRQLTLELADLI